MAQPQPVHNEIVVQQIHKFDKLSLICKSYCYSAVSSVKPDYLSNSGRTNMAPSFDSLSDHDFQEEDEEEEIDFSDLREQYDVHMEEGLDTFVVCLRNEALPHLADIEQVVDGLPIVNLEQKPKLLKFLLKKLTTAGKTREEAIHMPMNDKGMSEGFVKSSRSESPCSEKQVCVRRIRYARTSRCRYETTTRHAFGQKTYNRSQ